MSPSMRVLPLVLTGLSLMVSSARTESVATRPIAAPAAAARQQEIVRERAQRDELGRRIQAACEQSSKVIEGLSVQAAAMRDPNVRVQIDRRVAQAKRDFQMDLLRIQAQFARENGRVAQAQELEAQVAAAIASGFAGGAQAGATATPATPAHTATVTPRPVNGGAR